MVVVGRSRPSKRSRSAEVSGSGKLERLERHMRRKAREEDAVIVGDTSKSAEATGGWSL